MAEPSEPTPGRPFLEFRRLLRAPGIASDGRKLVLALGGLFALAAGWWGVWAILGDPDSPFKPSWMVSAVREIPGFSWQSLGGVAGLMSEPFRTVVLPFAGLFATGAGPAAWARSALMAVWAVAVWGIFGGAIARIAVVEAATGTKVGVGSAIRFALGKSASLIGAPLTPAIAVGFFAGLAALFGLTTRIPWGVGTAIGSGLGFVPLVLGLLNALVLVGLALGWPLMHATVAAEGEDAPDALSRSYSYVNQRLARYAAHAAASWLIGSVGLVVVIAFGRIVIGLSDWGVALGSGDQDSPARDFWAGLVGLVVHAWIYSYFWTSASIVYLILRLDVDGTPWHDVSLPEHGADTFAGNPAEEAPKPVEVVVG